MAQFTAFIVMLASALLAVAAIAATVPLATDCLSPSLAASGRNLYPKQFQASGILPVSPTSQVNVAQHFTIQYFDTYKIVNNTYAYSQETYVLYQCGTTPPSTADIPSGAKVLQIPLASLSVTDSGAFAYLKALGVSNRIEYVGTVIIDACMQALSGPGCNKATLDSSAPGYLAQAQAVSATLTGGADAEALTSIAVTGYADPGVLNKAEWIKFVAAFFNLEATANSIFASISANYASVTNAVAATAAPVSSTQRPLVAWVIYIPGSVKDGYGESWAISIAAYKVDLTEDAGGRMHQALDLLPYADANKGATFSAAGGLRLTNRTHAFAIMHEALSNVDILIDESGYEGVRDYDVQLSTFTKAFGFTKAADLTKFKFLKNQAIYRHDGITNAGYLNDWFEGAVVHPDQVLLDLVLILSPPVATARGVTAGRWIRNLNVKPTVITASQCSTLSGCKQTPQPICPSIYQSCNGSIVYATAAQPCAPDCSPPPPPPTNAAGLAQPALAALLAAALLSILTLACC